MKLGFEIVEPYKEKPFVVIFETEWEDRGIVGEGVTVDTAMRNAARNLRKMAARLDEESHQCKPNK